MSLALSLGSPIPIPETRSINSPSITLSSAGRLWSLGSTPLRPGFDFSISDIASSICLLMVGRLALSCRCEHRASLGTQKHVLGEILVWVFGSGGVLGEATPRGLAKPDKPALELMRGRGASGKGAGIRPCSRFGFWGSVFAQWLQML